MPEARAELMRLVSLGSDSYRISNQQLGRVEAITEHNNIVALTIQITGLQPNSSHALHLHDGSCEEPGAHWNQGSDESFCGRESLGFPWFKSKAGDIGNVIADENGEAHFIFKTDLWSLNTGLHTDILDKVLIIHAQADDFGPECFLLSTHDHFSNTKIACGRILPVVD